MRKSPGAVWSDWGTWGRWNLTHTPGLELDNHLGGVCALVKDGECQFLVGFIEFMSICRLRLSADVRNRNGRC